MTLEQEQEAFDKLLDFSLLSDHAGEWVLFKEGRPVAFFEDHVKAYEAGLEKFGLDVPFLIEEVAKRSPETVSFALEAGVELG